MELRRLGRTGVEVSALGLGTLLFGRDQAGDEADAVRIVHAALDAGINLIDTADVYAGGRSEEIVGRAIKGRRDDVVLATKAFHPMGADPNARGGSRRWLVRACEASLRRLDTDRIDLYQLHRPDPSTDVDETLGALSDLIHAGKVLYAGSSTFPASQIVEAQWMAERRGRERFASEQAPYSILARGVEADVLPTCRRHGLGVLCWSPLAAGWLSGRWRMDAAAIDVSRARLAPAQFDLDRPENRRTLDAADQLARVADDAGLSMVHLAVAFVLRHPAVTSAILGPRTLEQLEGQLGAVDVAVGDDVLDRIDDIVAPGDDLVWSADPHRPYADDLNDVGRRRR